MSPQPLFFSPTCLNPFPISDRTKDSILKPSFFSNLISGDSPLSRSSPSSMTMTIPPPLRDPCPQGLNAGNFLAMNLASSHEARFKFSDPQRMSSCKTSMLPRMTVLRSRTAVGEMWKSPSEVNSGSCKIESCKDHSNGMTTSNYGGAGQRFAYKAAASGITREKLDQGSLVDVGLSKNVKVDQALEPGTRVTVEMGTNRNLDGGPRKIVSPSRPMEEGMYWGYKVRYAANISSVFKNCPYQGGYDHRIGTSEHGSVINSSELTLPSFKHLLIAFGGLAGLEECVEEDADLKGKTVSDIFDSYLNTCPHQGSRTIRTEEAVFISLQYFQEPISRVSQKYDQ